jgi:hypothetical protein
MSTYVALTCAFLFPVAFAYESERAQALLARESAECAGYFTTVSRAPGLDATTRNRLRSDAKSLIELSTKLTSQKLASSRAHLAARTMLREIGEDWARVSTLDNTYQHACENLVADPKARMQYWLDKRD